MIELRADLPPVEIPLLILLVTTFAAAGASAVGTTWIRIRRGGRDAPAETGDAIVVFGAAAGPRGPSPELAARLSHAAALYFEGRAPTILCSGGFTGPTSEAHAMRDALVARGVDPADIAVDDTGVSTRRAVSAAVRHGAGRWRRVIAVSSPYHMHRIVAEARRQGLAVVASPAATTPITRATRARVRQTLREVIAVWLYAARPHTSS